MDEVKQLPITAYLTVKAGSKRSSIMRSVRC